MSATLAALAERSPDELSGLRLEPDGRYQVRATTLREVTGEVVERLRGGFAGRSAESFPHLVCITGKCRTGSTALTNLFGIAGVPAYYQPVKTILRHRLLGGPGDAWALPDAGAHTHVAAKEMTGPYTLAECLFNPLECLTRAGYPTGRLHLLLLDRDPYESLASWLAKWSDRVPREELMRNFVLASVAGERLHAYAVEHGIDSVTYVHALTRWPHEAVAALLGRLGIGDRYEAGVVEDWGARGALESGRAPLIFPDEPQAYRVAGLHSSETDYSFKRRDTSGLAADERALIAEASLVESYERSVERSCRDLPLPDRVREALAALPLAAGG
ncbi:MAG: sulfotransferase family protein [Actinomycetota bacterium]|nr:sulfotransferase family protein [Actinomycetota bacterium]